MTTSTQISVDRNGFNHGYVLINEGRYEGFAKVQGPSGNSIFVSVGLFDTQDEAEIAVLRRAMRPKNSMDCPDCEGKGKRQDDEDCEMCQGSGWVSI